MRLILAGCCLAFLFSCHNTATVQYPETTKKPVVDSYFGTSITDNYRWLEDDLSQETAAWVSAQNETTFSYLDRIPYRSELTERLTSIWDYAKQTAPFVEGDFTYYYRNSGLQNQYVLYRKNTADKEEVFLNPNTFSEDGTTSLAGLSFSDDGKTLAYAISEGGSDWRKVIVMDAGSKKILEDTLKNIKFSGIQWKRNEGFYYSSYDKPQGSVLSDKTDQHKLYFHKQGTPQAEDQLVFGATPAEKNRYVGADVTEDGAYLFIYASESTSGNKLFLKNLKRKNTPLIPIVDNYDSDTYLVDSDDRYFYFVTNYNAPNKRLVRARKNKPQQVYWQDVIPEKEYVLSVSSGSGYLFAKYMIDAISKVYQYDYTGTLMGEISLPGLGTAGGFGGKKEQDTLYYSFSNYHTPGSIYAYDPKNMTSQSYWKPGIDFDSEAYVSKQVFYESKDGTKVPMIITHKKGIEYTGENPTILYGYGGFNISQTPRFSITNAVWMEHGGVYAVPNIRGGGEYGKKWHIAGTKTQKQNVFDDFIAAAEYLIQENLTRPQLLAIRGGSNGGLLVGACLTQRPELFKVALPAVGVLDMLRYHTFTAGAGWAYDYGTAEESEEMFRYLKDYSPVHNVKAGTHYPATLITTGDHDDRVVPAHSFKFAAQLQDKQAGNSPVLIRIETKAGHGAGTPVSKIIDQYADIFGFTLYNMGYKVLPQKTGKIKG